MYQQGWIDSSYISSKYLDFRFQEGWINEKDNQNVYLFNSTLSSTPLNKETSTLINIGKEIGGVL